MSGDARPTAPDADAIELADASAVQRAGDGDDNEAVESGSQAAAAAAATTFPELSRTRSILLVAAISSAAFLTIFNMSTVVIVLPSIGRDLGIPASGQQLVVSLYNIALGCLMLLWGRTADVYGHRPVFLVGSGLFTLSTLCLPFAAAEVPFCILRFVQGMGGAAMVPAGLGTIATTFAPGPARNRGFVAVAAVASLGSILGNLAGGLVGGYLSWKWVFWIPAIVAAITTTAAAVITHDANKPRLARPPRNKAASVDWLGGAVVSSGLLLLLVALSEGNVVGWSTPWVPTAFAIAVVLLAGFVVWQRHLERRGDAASARQPLLRVSMFGNVKFSALLVMIACFFASYTSFMIFASYFYQDYLGLSELQTTLRFLPAGISGILASLVLSQALSRVRAFYILVLGLASCTVPPLLFAVPAIPPHTTTYWAYGFPAMVLGFSVEVIWPVGSLVMARELPRDDQAMGSALFMTANFVGRALGLALASAAQSSVHGDTSSAADNAVFLRGLHAAQWVNVGLGLAALSIALLFFRNLGRQ